MPRHISTLALLMIIGCGGPHATPRTLPAPSSSPLVNGRRTPATFDSLRDSGLPPAPLMDSLLVAADFAAEGRLAADSAADEAVLEELATAHPDSEEADSKAEEATDGGA